MKIKNILLLMLIMFAGQTKPVSWGEYFSPLFTQAQALWTKSTDTQKMLGKFGTAAVIIYAGYKLAGFIQSKFTNYVSDKIENEIADSIVLVLTTNAAIKRLSEGECEFKLKKKADLIILRQEVMLELAKRIGNLPETYKHDVRAKFESVKGAFDLIDGWRNSKLLNALGAVIKNPYEHQVDKNSMKFKFIKNKMVEAALLSLKPSNICLPSEMKTKQEAELRRARVIARLEGRIEDIWINKLKQHSLLISLFN